MIAVFPWNDKRANSRSHCGVINVISKLALGANANFEATRNPQLRSYLTGIYYSYFRSAASQNLTLFVIELQNLTQVNITSGPVVPLNPS